MIYFENSARGAEGFNTHLMSYTLCISLSNFLERDFFFEYEIPCSTPPVYASDENYKEKFSILLDSPRSLVSDLVDIPNRRRFEIDRQTENKAKFELLYSHFITTEELRSKFEGTVIWDSFSIGRIPLIRENLETYDLIEWTHTKLSHPSCFYFLKRPEKQQLLDSVKIKYLDEIEKLAETIAAGSGRFNAIHLRLGDFLTNYKNDDYSVEHNSFKKYIKLTFPDESLPILAATDSLHEKEMFSELFKGYKLQFIDELIFDHYRREFVELPFTDFNVISILNQLLCSSAEVFIGTYRSTFTSMIHRMRQERYRKTDFNFFPDPKVARLLNSDGRIAPDRHGFFDWNRYSVFSEDHAEMAWMREWNHELSSLDI